MVSQRTGIDFAIRYGFLTLLLGLVVFFGLFAEGFVSPFSAVFIFQSVAITGILALGVTFTLVVDGFDLSIGSTATSALMLSAYVMVVLEMGAVVAVLACLLMGAVIGLINGLLIVKTKVPDLLATLGMMFLLIGLQRIPTEGRSIATGMTLPGGEKGQRYLRTRVSVARPSPVRFLHPQPDSGLGYDPVDCRGAGLGVSRDDQTWTADVCHRVK